MTEGAGRTPPEIRLRRLAEARAGDEPTPDDVDGESPLLHELRVHRIELEMQNDALRSALRRVEEAQTRFQSLFESAPVGYLCVDAKWAIREANRVAAGMLGVERAALLGRPIASYVAPVGQDALHLHRRSLTGGAAHGTVELPLSLPDGRCMPVRIDTVPTSEGGGAHHYYLSLTDMTEQNAATEATRTSEAWHRTVLEAALDGFVQVDASGRLTRVNASLEEMTGYNRGELLGMRYADLWADGGAEACAATMHRAVHEDGQTFEARYKRKDGSMVDVEASLQYDRSEGGKLVGFVRDVTERKRLDIQRSEGQRLESIGRLAGGVAHDFNNMLGVILGRLELALDRLPVDEPVAQDLLQAQQAARHSATLTRDLLAFARQEAVTPRLTDLNEIIAGMADMLRSMLGERISLEIRPAADPWPVRADLTQMSQALMNLCINGRDAVQGAGAITIETRNVIVTEADCAASPGHEPGEYAALTVRDTGCGIAPDTLARMFEPFFTTKGVGEGTGLGLAQVYGAAAQNGGMVRAESVVGQGAAVHLFLPRAAGRTAPAAPTGPSERPSGRGETVLLVEDERGMLTTCRRFLTPLGYDVMSASTPAEALALSDATIGTIDLLLTDVVMPEMDGAELADRLAAERPGLKRLFMSGYTAEALGARLLRHNATLLPKPFTRDELARAVRAALDGPAPAG